MLKGFTESGLVVFPLYSDYIERPSSYRNKLNLAVANIAEYLRYNEISVDYFSTDDVAHEVSVSPDRWAITLNKGDMFFVQNNCDGGTVLGNNVIEFDDVYSRTAEKYPIARGLSVERRFEVTLKRDQMARRIISKRYKLVILVKQQKSPALRFVTKKDSGVIYVEIDNITFLATCWMSDMKMDITEILGIRNANMPVYEWEVPSGNNVL